MKKSFSKSWNKSVQPRKQRKYAVNAPLHVKQNIMKCNLSKELRKHYKVRSVRARKGDKVKIMRGQFKGKEAKIEKVDRRNYKLLLEGVKLEKKDGTKVDFKIHYSNVQLIELDLSDKKRFKTKKTEKVK
ncbi:MAG: 50S ribosomal protein L24 [Nanoarchaeota archaeon]|nr:50S ribosomal protein L24 [Nanoarchaeota archaeon]